MPRTRIKLKTVSMEHLLTARTRAYVLRRGVRWGAHLPAVAWLCGLRVCVCCSSCGGCGCAVLCAVRLPPRPLLLA